MLQIRPEQMQVFAKQKEDRFLERLDEHVQRTFPKKAAAMGAQGRSVWLRQAVKRGRGHGFETERQLASFADLTFVAGMEFDRTPWAQPVLRNEKLDHDGRLRRLQVAARRHAAGGAS